MCGMNQFRECNNPLDFRSVYLGQTVKAKASLHVMVNQSQHTISATSALRHFIINAFKNGFHEYNKLMIPMKLFALHGNARS